MSKDLIDTINDDIDAYDKDIIKYASKAIRDRLEKVTKDAIAKFYNDYTPGDHYRANHPEETVRKPWFYQRTENLKNAYKVIYKNHGDHITSGVILSPEYMDDIYNGTRTMVFNMTWGMGYHGHDAWEPTHEAGTGYIPYAITTPSPMWEVKKEYRKILAELEEGTIQDEAEKKASADREKRHQGQS